MKRFKVYPVVWLREHKAEFVNDLETAMVVRERMSKRTKVDWVVRRVA